ncbi:MAG: nitrate/sulfonate/bicarbonate ABC transporter ATP-binding protein [Cycloclasticus sp. symbiont of Poecilosclerida sp. N]|nr:MAG: nitrate/sulfonate/bicarbonate ABC transporter ATP-binding protein [Cycloclasticus sp. symbiont of Poecilosclerida sp. N]
MSQLTVDIKRKIYPQNGNKAAFVAIKDLRFELSSNEFVCIVGPSGCGKTTLLNIIAQLDQQFDGVIQWDNNSAEIKSSYVFQTPRLLPWRSVMENIQLANNNQNSFASMKSLLQKLGLENNLDSFPNHLSLGMQRRVALARAFCVQSDILLMDEPFVSLDQPTARKARELLLALWQEQPRCIIFVTHDLNEAIELADRVVFLSESPSSVAGDIDITIPRDKRYAKNIAAFKQQLSTSHPSLNHLI